MADKQKEQAFRRSPAYLFWSLVWGALLAALGLSSIHSGRTVWLIVCLGASVCFFVNAVWSWMVPYVRVDKNGVTTYPAIVAPPRHIEWANVKNVRSKANGRLYLLDADFQGMSIRIKTVTTAERGSLVKEIGLRSGCRLLPMPAKSAKSL
jgi:hypothetical protein